jgi:hypothetical protein
MRVVKLKQTSRKTNNKANKPTEHNQGECCCCFASRIKGLVRENQCGFFFLLKGFSSRMAEDASKI